jgi:hypothetical protein
MWEVGGLRNFAASVHLDGQIQQQQTGSGALAGSQFSQALQTQFNALGQNQRMHAIDYLLKHNRGPLAEQLIQNASPQQVGSGGNT